MSKSSTNYSSYIQISTILASQHPKTKEDEDAVVWGTERFFIVSHQVSELWLSQILVDIKQAASLSSPSSSADWHNMKEALRRAASIMLMLCNIIEQLIHCCPKEKFLKFRDRLDGISAVESIQFREMFQLIDGTHIHLKDIKCAISKFDNNIILNIPSESDKIKLDKFHAEEALRILQKGCKIWRESHMLVASYFIDNQAGTGGTHGVEYLKKGLIEREASKTRNKAYSPIKKNSEIIPAKMDLKELKLTLQSLQQELIELGE